MRGDYILLLRAAQEPVKLLQARVGADLVEALRDLAAGELAPREEGHLDLGEVDDPAPREGVERGPAENAQSVVDVAHGREPVPLVVGADRSVLEPDVARVVALAVLEDGHEAQFPRLDEAPADGLVVDGQVAVAVEHVERFPEQGQGLDQRAAGPEELRTVERVVDPDAPILAVAVALDDPLAEVADAEDDVREAGLPYEPQLVGEEGFPRHLDQELGQLLRDRLQAGGETAGQDGHRKLRGVHPRSADPPAGPPAWRGGLFRTGLIFVASQFCATTLVPS